jgi:YVTN family beta-propeller protein
VDFRILGPLEVSATTRPLPLGGAKPRALLTVLLLHRNAAVSSDRLIDALWGERPPDSAAKSVQIYISQLRKVLGEGRVETSARGYRLHVQPGELDLDRVEALADEAATQAAPRAAKTLRQALTLFRGEPLAGLSYEPWALREAERLEELRLELLERRIDADLVAGQHRRLVPELIDLVTRYPLREGVRAQLMVALYRTGRQAEALETYRAGRQALQENLGLEPSPELRELEQAILRHDDALKPPPEAYYRRVRQRRSLLFALVAIATVFGAALTAAVLASTRGDGAGPVVVRRNSVAVIDPHSNRVVADIPVGAQPGPVAVGQGGTVFVGNTLENTVSEIDARTRTVIGILGADAPTDLAQANGVLWAGEAGPPLGTGGTLLRVDLSVPNGLRTPFAVGPNLSGSPEQTVVSIAPVVGFGPGAVWVGNQDSATVRRIDPLLERVIRIIHGIRPGGIAADRGAVWVSDPARNQLWRIDPTTDKVVAKIPVPGRPTRVALGDGAVWVATRFSRGAIWRISPTTNELVATTPVSPWPTRITYGAGAIWVTSFRTRTLRLATGGASQVAQRGLVTRIDPATSRATATIRLGYPVDGLAVSHGLVWVAVDG